MAATRTDFDYHTYLASREWSLLREAVRERSGNTCEHCFLAPQQAVHHLTYERIGHEELEDLMAVCNPCHEFFSGKSDHNPAYIYVVSPALQLTGHRVHVLIPRCDVAPRKSVVRYADCRPGCIWCPGDSLWWVWTNTLELRDFGS